MVVGSHETARILASFEQYTGTFVWHCHILEHKDLELIRTFRMVAVPKPITAFFVACAILLGGSQAKEVDCFCHFHRQAGPIGSTYPGQQPIWRNDTFHPWDRILGGLINHEDSRADQTRARSRPEYPRP